MKNKLDNKPMRELFTDDEKFIFDNLYDLVDDFAKGELTIYRYVPGDNVSYNATDEIADKIGLIKSKFCIILGNLVKSRQ